jgi:hypothetical protein
MSEKAKKKRQSPLHINLSFDDAMSKILKAKPIKKRKK